MKILLADDDEISRRIIASFLGRFGYEVMVVEDGAEAWEILQRSMAPSLAIFDWMMPRMSGLDVCLRVRKLQRPVRTYIILLSSRNSKLDIVKGLEAGADDYLSKPCDLAELQARLRVAERTLMHEGQLRRTINDLERLVRRHHLLGQIAGQHQLVTPGEEPAEQPTTRKAGAAPELREALAGGFEGIGLGAATLSEAGTDSRAPEFTVWLPLYFPRERAWVEVRFEVRRGGAHELARAILKRGAKSGQELQDVLVETIHLLGSSRVMARLKHDVGMISLMALALGKADSEALAGRKPAAAYGLRAGDFTCNVTEYRETRAPVNKSVAELSPGDMVVEQVLSPETSQMVLLSQGDLLTENRIANLQAESPTVVLSVVPLPEAGRKLLPLGL